MGLRSLFIRAPRMLIMFKMRSKGEDRVLRRIISTRTRIFGILVVVGASIFGATQALGSPNSTPTLSPPEPDQAAISEPLASYQQPTGPLLSDADVHSLALREAVRAGDSNPSAVLAVDTTLTNAERAVEPQAVIPETATGGAANFEHSAVSLVVLHGNFTLFAARVPRGRPAPTGTVLSLAVDAHTGAVDMRSIQTSDPSGLSALGTVRSLR